MKHFFVLLLCLLLGACEAPESGINVEDLQRQNERLREDITQLQSELLEAQRRVTLVKQREMAAGIVAACDNLNLPDWACGMYTANYGRAALVRGFAPAPGWELLMRTYVVLLGTVLGTSMVVALMHLVEYGAPILRRLQDAREEFEALPDVRQIRNQVKAAGETLADLLRDQENARSEFANETTDLEARIAALQAEQTALEQRNEFLRRLK